MMTEVTVPPAPATERLEKQCKSVEHHLFVKHTSTIAMITVWTAAAILALCTDKKEIAGLVATAGLVALAARSGSGSLMQEEVKGLHPLVAEVEGERGPLGARDILISFPDVRMLLENHERETHDELRATRDSA